MEESIIVAGGCFWCTEAIFSPLRGVTRVVSGYTGGTVPYPTYLQVCSGKTGHVEAVEVTFNPQEISLHDLLIIFFTLHDPTTLNRQGADIGTEYRSAIFYANESQRQVAEVVMQEITMQRIWNDPIVTELCPRTEFYPAEGYH